MNSMGDAFGWAFRDPQWPGKILVQGLILIIPIVGWIAMNGWLLMAFENARAGRNELPPAGFHLERGIAMFGVFLIYGIGLGIPGSGLISAASAGGGQSAPSAPPLVLGILLSVAGSLFLNFLAPPLIVHTSQRGFGGGMDIQSVWRLTTANVSNSLLSGLIVFIVSFLGGL